MDAKAFGLIAVLLLVSGALLFWVRRKRSPDHDVSDPGVTL